MRQWSGRAVLEWPIAPKLRHGCGRPHTIGPRMLRVRRFADRCGSCLAHRTQLPPSPGGGGSPSEARRGGVKILAGLFRSPHPGSHLAPLDASPTLPLQGRVGTEWLAIATLNTGDCIAPRPSFDPNRSVCARGALRPRLEPFPRSCMVQGEGRWCAGRRNQLRAHEARRAPWSGAHASRRSTAAMALVSLETITGSGPRFAGAFAPSVSELLAAGS